MGNVLSAKVRLQSNLEQAAVKGSVADAKYFVSLGADPQLSSVEGWNALHHACLGGHTPVVAYFVEQCRASVHASNVDRSTPLMLAVTSQSAELVAYLLQHGALPNDQQKEGLAALHLAAIMKQPSIVTLLRTHGASDAVLDDQKRRPSSLVAADDDWTRAAFEAPVTVRKATVKDDDFESASSEDDAGADDVAVPTLSRDNIEALCAQLHSTFAHVKDLGAIDEMIAFYSSELLTLKRRRKACLQKATSAAAKKALDDDDDDDADDDADNDDDDKPTEMLPLISE
jgi:hypothetical protein